MTYAAQADLATDPDFMCRVSACGVQQATLIGQETGPAGAAYAEAIVRMEGAAQTTLHHMVAAAPGFADNVDQSGILDEQLVAAVQATWPDAAAAYYHDDGTPKLLNPGLPGVVFKNFAQATRGFTP